MLPEAFYRLFLKNVENLKTKHWKVNNKTNKFIKHRIMIIMIRSPTHKNIKV